MPQKHFLEKYSLYQRLETDISIFTSIKNLPTPAINLMCKECKSFQTFNMANVYYEVEKKPDDEAYDKIFRLKYVCSSCHENERQYFVRFEAYTAKDKEGEERQRLSVLKVGQSPPLDTKIPKQLEKYLDKDVQMYQKGITSEKQSYGIGAFAYYRRITEKVIGKLIDDIYSNLLEKEERKRYLDIFDEIKKTKQANEKIKLAQSILPHSLIIEGTNPLKLLYTALSTGLHSKSDEECLQQAEIVRGVLGFFINKIVTTKTETSKFKKNVLTLLDEKK